MIWKKSSESAGRLGNLFLFRIFFNKFMHPLVRDLYKRFLLVGRDYPLGLNYVREKVCIIN